MPPAAVSATTVSVVATSEPKRARLGRDPATGEERPALDHEAVLA